MGAPKGLEKGTRQSLKLQVGVSVPEFGGMVREGDSGGVPDNAFHAIENAISVGGGLRDRPGLQRVNTGTPLGSVVIEGIFDATDIGAAQ